MPPSLSVWIGTLSNAPLIDPPLNEQVTTLSFQVAAGNKALYKMESNQIMVKSPVCGCVTNLGCPYNPSQMMTEEGNKGAYSHCHCHSESLGAETHIEKKRSLCLEEKGRGTLILLEK